MLSSLHTVALDRAARLRASIATTAYVSCYQYESSTYDFYHYPARFPPEVARAVIEEFSQRGAFVLDPFMGGGTSIVEGILLGRRMVGVDINALAHFITTVRTRPISDWDEIQLNLWAADVMLAAEGKMRDTGPPVRNLPPPVRVFMATALDLARKQLTPRQNMFARAVLLRLGQWSLEARGGREVQPRRRRLARQLPVLLDRMLAGMRAFVDQCRSNGIGKRAIQKHRILINRTAVGIDKDEEIANIRRQPSLVFTSPPYAGVNVLYHRWQHRGRRETPAPYWIANVPDGYGAQYYTGGSRTPTGLDNYFGMITGAFTSATKVLADGGHVVQLVGFSDVERQLPTYLECMRMAGLVECSVSGGRLARRVANRRWYAKLKGEVDASTEFLLIHRKR
jgi:hypothetical protein